MNICTSIFSVIIDVRAIIEPWNPNKTKKGMYIFGFTKDGVVKKYCTVEKCIFEVKKETPDGKQMIELTRKLATLKVY